MPRAILLTPLLALSLAAPAAAETIVAHAVPRAGPVIAGRVVEWVEGGGTRPLVVRGAAPGASPRVALRIPRPAPDRRRMVTALVAAGTHVQLAYRTVRKGAPCVPHTQIAGIALAGSTLVALEQDLGCAPQTVRAYRVVVRRAHRPALVLAQGTTRLAHLTAGGRYVAWQQAGDATNGDPVLVYDLLTGRLAYRASDPSLELGHDQLALDATGRLAVSAYDPSASSVGSPRYDLMWWARGGHTAHPLSGLFASDGPIRFHGGRIAFERPTGFGGSELTISDLAGRTVSIARFGPGRSKLLGFDYSGSTVAWAQRGPGPSTLILRTSVPAGTG